MTRASGILRNFVIRSSVAGWCSICNASILARTTHICPSTISEAERTNLFRRRLREEIARSPEASDGYWEAQEELRRIRERWPFNTRLYECYRVLESWFFWDSPPLFRASMLALRWPR
jgi:hypothetical protein